MRKKLDGIQYMENKLREKEIISKSLQLKLLKGEVHWEDEAVQFFIPVALSFTDFDWLKLIAEHHCIKEDEEVVKNFLDMCESLKDFNNNTLQNTVLNKLRRFK